MIASRKKMDSQLVDNIVSEVKSQGIFDEFRRDSMADVDTKPAYQNLRKRVENTVKKFLSEQIWTPEMNKNQLRERLRRHINEVGGFLDVGVERIVDQVVNPKIASVFQPKIEDIAYKYLNIPKPNSQLVVGQTLPISQNGTLQIETANLLPTDLEQVSPDSDKITEKSDSREDLAMDVDNDEKVDEEDEDESPPFEPLEGCLPSPRKEENVNEISKIQNITEICVEENSKKSNALKEENHFKCFETDFLATEKPTASNLDKCDVKETNFDIQNATEATQQSQLSQVSSNSRLSIVTHENTETGDDQISRSHIKQDSTVNISEEAQMPQFNENSNGEHTPKNGMLCRNNETALHFDIRKDVIKFEGTERKTELASPISKSPNDNCDRITQSENISTETSNCDFSFSNTNFKSEEAVNVNKKDPSVERELSNFEKCENTQGSASQFQSKPDLKLEENLKKKMTDVDASKSLNVPIPNQIERDRDRDESTRLSSSSSFRHKKHHKEHRSEKERKMDRSRGREKDKHGSSDRKSSNTCSNASGASRNSHSQKIYSTSSSHKHKSKHHSHNDKYPSKSRDSKKEKISSKSESLEHKSRSPKKNEEKQQADDHYASKNRMRPRKSTDSNDDEKSREKSKTSRNVSNSANVNETTTLSESSSKPFVNSCPTDGKQCSLVEQELKASEARVTSNDIQKPVILDSFLDNPETNFIQFALEGGAPVQICTFQTDDISNQQLQYFEDNNKEQFTSRLNLIHQAIANCRKLIDFNAYNASQNNRNMNETDAEHSLSPVSSRSKQQSVSPQFLIGRKNKSDPTNVSTTALHIDCEQFNRNGDESSLAKRFKLHSPITKISPTPSELSVNSKENEFVDRNYSISELPLAATEVCAKLSQSKQHKTSQRYLSSDLYKPRPMLGQRSKRRHLDIL